MGFIGLVLTVAPVILVWRGEEIRRRSPFMRESRFGEETRGGEVKREGSGVPIVQQKETVAEV